MPVLSAFGLTVSVPRTHTARPRRNDRPEEPHRTSAPGFRSVKRVLSVLDRCRPNPQTSLYGRIPEPARQSTHQPEHSPFTQAAESAGILLVVQCESCLQSLYPLLPVHSALNLRNISCLYALTSLASCKTTDPSTHPSRASKKKDASFSTSKYLRSLFSSRVASSLILAVITAVCFELRVSLLSLPFTFSSLRLFSL